MTSRQQSTQRRNQEYKRSTSWLQRCSSTTARSCCSVLARSACLQSTSGRKSLGMRGRQASCCVPTLSSSDRRSPHALDLHHDFLATLLAVIRHDIHLASWSQGPHLHRCVAAGAQWRVGEQSGLGLL